MSPMNLLGLLVLSNVLSAGAAPLLTCALQSNCIAFDIRHVMAPRMYEGCGSCQVEVCIKRLSRKDANGNTLCAKDSSNGWMDPISHACMKDQCPVESAMLKTPNEFDQNSMLCERISPTSGIAKFIVKDGSSGYCEPTMFPSPTQPPMIIGDYFHWPEADAVAFRCGTSVAAQPGFIEPGFDCESGQAKKNTQPKGQLGECVWEVTVPPAMLSKICDEPPPPPPPVVTDASSSIDPEICVLDCPDTGFQNVVSTNNPQCDWDTITARLLPYDCNHCDDRKLVCLKTLSADDEAFIEACI